MPIGMRADIMAFLIKGMYDRAEQWLREETSGEEKRRLAFFSRKGIEDIFPSICKFITGEYQCHFFTGAVPSYNASLDIGKAFFAANGGSYYFFGLLFAASFAASK